MANCVVSGTLHKLDGVTPDPNGKIKVVYAIGPTGSHITDYPKEFRANTSGVVTFTIVQGATAYIFGEVANYRERGGAGVPVAIPATGTADLFTLSTVVVPGSGGLLSINALSGAVALAAGTSGTDFAISAAGSTITYNLPAASATAAGKVTTGTQTFAGAKTFTSEITGATSGKAFSSVDNALEGVTTYNKMAIQRGTSGMAAETQAPIINFQIHQRPNGVAATTFNYSFRAIRHGSNTAGDGDASAVYSLDSVITSDKTGLGTDIVAVAGRAAVLAGSNDHSFGLFADSSTLSATGLAVGLETDIRNLSGAIAGDMVNGASPAIIGQSVIAFNGSGGTKNTAAFLITSIGGLNSAFRTGLWFGVQSIDTDLQDTNAGAPVENEPGRAIDMRNVQGTAIPILMANGNSIYSRNAANNANVAVVGLDSGNQVAFGAGLRPGTGAFVAGTAQVYKTAAQGLVLTAGTGSVYDLLIASRAGSTLLAVVTNTDQIQVGMSPANVLLGTGAQVVGATTGFPYMGTIAGTPTTAPTVITGFVPFTYDTAANKIWIYNGGAWKATAALT